MRIRCYFSTFRKIMLCCVLFATALPLFSQIENIYYEYEQTRGDELGYMFHAKCSVHGQMNKKLNFVIFFYDKDDKNIASSNSNGYKTTSGQLCTWEENNAPYENTLWEDFKLFVPYSAMKNMKRGEKYYYRMYIRDISNNYKNLYYTEKKEMPEWERHEASLDSIGIVAATKNDMQGFNISYVLHVVGNVGTDYEVLFQFYDQNRQPIPGSMDGYKTAGTPGTATAWESGLKPRYMHSVWRNRSVFIPYNAFGYSAYKQFYYRYWIRKNNDNSEVLYCSDFEPLNTVSSSSKPVVTWLSSVDTQPSKAYQFRAGVKSSSQILSTSLMVNGQSHRGFKVVNNDGYDMNVNETLALSEGSNTIRLTVVNGAGETSIERTIYCSASQNAVVNPQKRLALVIGNSNYPSQRLANPVNDATDVAGKLQTLGFDVILLTDANKRQMEEKIQEFGARAANYEVALFYYAGHGIQYNGRNFLIPVNVELHSPSDIEYDCTEANRVLAKMDEAGCQTNIVVLDACRNNPFERSWSRGAGNYGLSTMNAPRGTLIAYATSPGNVAQDGKTRNSPYTAAFLQALDIQGMSIYEFFPYVSGLVQDATGNAQVPWISSSVSGKFYFNYAK